MKSINTKVKDEYPCLKVYIPEADEGEFVVLFTEPNTGTVVNDDEDMHELGEYSDEWAEDNFKMFEGQIILEN